MGARAGKYKFGARAGKHKVGTRAGKYKLGARARKYKLRARAGKYKLGARAGSQGQGRGPSNGPGAGKYKHPFLQNGIYNSILCIFFLHRLIDFQVSSCCSPPLDLLYCLFFLVDVLPLLSQEEIYSKTAKLVSESSRCMVTEFYKGHYANLYYKNILTYHK